LADVLKADLLKPELLKADTRFWAVDKVILAYFAFQVVVIFGWWSKVPYALPLLAANLISGAAIVYQVKRPNATSGFFRDWYWLPYVGACYKEMALFIPAMRGSDADQWLADLDFRIWGVHPSVWLERVHTPVLTEFLQAIYTLFIPAFLYIAWVLWRKGRSGDYRYYAFLITLGFLTSYVGYLLVPARGPRFLLKHLQHFPLQGLWLFHAMQGFLDRLESAHYDCFPSGHTELTILAWWGSRMVSKGWFRVYLAYTPLIIFATVYLRYHYTVDLLAGVVTAAVLIMTAPKLYQKLSAKGL
jgi:membrane-associated phospholipid phosphatase